MNNNTKFPSGVSTQSYDVISNLDIDSKGNQIDSKGNIINRNDRTKSYDILNFETEKSQENIDSYDENPIDETILNNENNKEDNNEDNIEMILQQSDKKLTQIENYASKRKEIINCITTHKKTKSDIKSKRQIRSLENHLQRLIKAELSNISFSDFKEQFTNELNINKNTCESVKKLWI
jgi:hypothetical protein